MKKIFVYGFYGQNNFGDDLFCYVIQNSAPEGAEIKIVGVTQEIFKKNAYLPIFINKLLVNKNSFLGKIYRIFLNISGVFLSDIVMYGGGSVFGKYASYKQRSIVINLAKFLNKNVYALGVSIGPFNSDVQESNFLNLISKLDGIWVRDKKSELYLSKYNIPYLSYGDMVFSLRNKLGVKKAIKGLMIVAIHELIYSNDIFEVINKHILNNGKVLILSLDPESEVIANIIQEKVKNNNISYINYSNNLIEIIDVFKSAEYVVTSKLHGAIISYILDIPFYLYEYQEKCTEFLKLINLYEYQDYIKKKYLQDNYIDSLESLRILENYKELNEFLLRIFNEK